MARRKMTKRRVTTKRCVIKLTVLFVDVKMYAPHSCVTAATEILKTALRHTIVRCGRERYSAKM